MTTFTVQTHFSSGKKKKENEKKISKALPPCISLKHLRKVRLEETPAQMQQATALQASAVHLCHQRSRIFMIALWSNLKLKKALDEKGNLQCPLHATDCSSGCSSNWSSMEQVKSYTASASKLS